MSKRSSTGADPPEGGDLALERLRRHLVFLGLTHTLEHLDELLAWALRERAGPTALLEHVLGAEVGSKLEARIARRVADRGADAESAAIAEERARIVTRALARRAPRMNDRSGRPTGSPSP